MLTLILIILVVMLLAGGGYGWTAYGYQGLGGAIGLFIIVLLCLWLLGVFR